MYLTNGFDSLAKTSETAGDHPAASFSNELIDIHNIGSFSVPGLMAKRIMHSRKRYQK